MEETINMITKELERSKILADLDKEILSNIQAAHSMRVSLRHLRRFKFEVHKFEISLSAIRNILNKKMKQ